MGLYDWLAVIGYTGVFVLYLFLLSDRLNLRIWVFLIISATLTAAVCVVEFVLYPTAMGIAAVFVCALFDVSCVVHLIFKRKRVMDLTKKKHPSPVHSSEHAASISEKNNLE